MKKRAWMLIGFGYYQAWFFSAVFGTALFWHAPEDAAHVHLVRILLLAALVVGYALCGVLGRALSRSRRMRPLLVVAACLASLGTLIIALPIQGTAAEVPLIVLGTLMTGPSWAMLIIAGGGGWTSAKADQATMCLVFSVVFACIVYIVVAFLPPTIAVAVLVALPLLYVVTWLKSFPEEKRDSPLAPLDFGAQANKVTAVLVFFSLVFGFSQGVASLADLTLFRTGQLWAFAAALLCSVVILAIAIPSTHSQLLRWLGRSYGVLFAIGLLALMIVPDGLRPFAHAFVLMGYIVFDDLTWLAQPDITFRSGKDAPYVFGRGRLVCHSAMLAGFLLGYVFLPMGGTGQVTLMIASAACILALVVTQGVIFTDTDFLRLIEPRESLETRVSLLERYRRIAEIYELSPREYEVMTFLAKGRSYSYIQDQLCIAQGTIKTHAGHIYKKLGVDSRQGLLDLVERTGKE